MGFTRINGKRYTSVDINNIIVNYQKGYLKQFRTPPRLGRWVNNDKRNKKIKKNRKRGMTYAELSDKYKLSESHLRRICD